MKLNPTHIILGLLVLISIAGGVVITLVAPSEQGDITVITPPTPDPAAASSQAEVGVYISGAVVNPGVYIVNEGNRLANIILIAGGATAEADLNAVNLAARVHDEQHWHIPRHGETHTPANQVNLNGDDRIDINSADVDLLKSLTGIGDVRANAIVNHRETHGAFVSIDALLDVHGISDGILNAIREQIVAH